MKQPRPRPHQLIASPPELLAKHGVTADIVQRVPGIGEPMFLGLS